MAKGSRITRVLRFFREGDPDEVNGVLALLGQALATRKDSGKINAISGLPLNPHRMRRSRRARINGADATVPTHAHQMEVTE